MGIGGRAADVAAGRLEIVNRQHFVGTDWLTADYDVNVDGVPIAGAPFDLPRLEPGGRGTVELPGWLRPTTGDGEAWLTVRFSTARGAGVGLPQVSRCARFSCRSAATR